MPKAKSEKSQKQKGKKGKSKPDPEPEPVERKISPPIEIPKKKKKEKPSKDELLKMISDGRVEIQQIIADLEEDFTRASSMGFKRVIPLIETTLKNLKEDLEDMLEEENYMKNNGQENIKVI